MVKYKQFEIFTYFLLKSATDIPDVLTDVAVKKFN